MLRKRTRSIQKDQQMYQIHSSSSESGSISSIVSGQRQKTNSFFSVPGLFVGLSPQVMSDCDSLRSPTSPLDFKRLSNFGNSLVRFPKPSHDFPQNSWDSNKVGLGSIVDDGGNNCVNLHEKQVTCSSSRTILFGSQVRSKTLNTPPMSLPKDYWVLSPRVGATMRPSNVFFGIGDNDPNLEFDPFEKIRSFSLDSTRVGLDMLRPRASSNIMTDFKTEQSGLECETSLPPLSYNTENKLTLSSPTSIAGGDIFAPVLTPSEIKLSEDYTCVISHGLNPKTTHIFGDCVLGCHPIGTNCGNNKKKISEIGLPFSEKGPEISPRSPYPSDDFLSFCCFCKNRLKVGTDIYMYRGESAFCSSECRLEGISIEEKNEKSIKETRESKNGDDIFEKSIFVAM